MKIRFRIVLVCAGLLAPPVLAAEPSAKQKNPPAADQQSAEILRLLGGGTKENDGWRLNRHWAGTLKTVSASSFYQKEKGEMKSEPVRFNVFNDSFRRGGDRTGSPALLAAGKRGATQVAIYRKELPPSADLKDQEKLSGICAAFGPQHGSTDGTIGGGESHWTEGWKWFGPAEKGRIRVLTVFVHVSQAKGKPKQFREWIMKEGVFNAYDPADKKGLREFHSEEENEVKREAEMDAEDNKHPEPLRSYVKAQHVPGDHELKTWFAAVRKFRDAPDGALVKQMAAALDDGTCEMSLMLDTLFQDMTFEKEIGKWEPKKRQQARVMLLDALPDADSRESLQKMTELALRETGVGSLSLKTSEIEVDELTSRYTRNGGPSVSYSSFEIKSGTVRRAGELLRDEILQRWKKKK